MTPVIISLNKQSHNLTGKNMKAILLQIYFKPNSIKSNITTNTFK